MDVNHSFRKHSLPNILFFTGLTIFQFSTLNGAYCGTTQVSTPAQGKEPEDRNGIAFSVTESSEDTSAVLRGPAGGEQGCVDSQVPFPVELPPLRTLSLANYSLLWKHPMALVSLCLHDHSHLTLLQSK